MSFEFTTPHAATLTSLTPRTEKHGDDDVFAVTFGLKITGPNTLLDKLSPTLRTALYRPVDDATAPLPEVEEATPKLRATGIDLITLKGALQGWTITIDHGFDENTPITLGDAKVDKFRVSPMEGGTVELQFRVGSNDIDATEAGLLCSHLHQEIQFTLAAPKIAAAPIDGSVDAFRKDHPEFEGPDATDLFAAGDASMTEGAVAEDDEDAGPDLEDRLDNALANADAERDQAELEAGMAASVAAAGVKPKRGRAAVKAH